MQITFMKFHHLIYASTAVKQRPHRVSRGVAVNGLQLVPAELRRMRVRGSDQRAQALHFNLR